MRQQYDLFFYLVFVWSCIIGNDGKEENQLRGLEL